jgi:mTERF
LKQPTLFQLSVAALQDRIAALDCIGERRDNILFEPANAGILCQSADSIRQKVMIVGAVAASKHPPVLGLSMENIRSKLEYFATLHPALASAILTKSPSVMSLKLESIQAKVTFLCQELWQNNTTETGVQLCQAPTCLSISLESNLRPTVAFFRTTQYWNDASSVITGRHLAASLYGRLLPRYLFHPDTTLSPLVFDSDAAFCGGRYLEFRQSDAAQQAVEQARWKLWLETGVRIPMED